MQTNETTSTAGHHNLATGVKTGSSKQSDSGSKEKLTVAKGDFETPGVGFEYQPQSALNELENADEKLQKYSGFGNYNIGFGHDEKTNTMIIEIINGDTGEITHQIPPDEIITLKEHMRDILGTVFDYLA